MTDKALDSIRTLEKKLSQCKKAGKEKVEILNQLSKAHWSSSPHKALDYGKQALEISEKINDKEGKGKAINTIGVSNYYLARYDSALECFFKALKIHEELGIKRKIASSYNNIGMIYDTTGKYENALEVYEKSIEIEKELGNKRGIANSLNNTGNVYGYLKKHDKALEHHKKALKIFEEINDKLGISASLNNIGDVYLTVIENPDNALKYLLKSLKINEEIGNKNRIAISLINLGDCYTKLRNPQKALPYLKRSLKISEEIEAKNLIRDCYIVYSELYSIKENYKKAIEYYKLYSETKDSIFNEESSNKIAEMQTKYETEKKEKEAEIFRLKNVELLKANISIQKKNEELNAHREHIKLINKILRHDLINNLAVIKSALNLYKNSNDKKVLEEASSKINKSIELINEMRRLESFISTLQELKFYEITEVLKGIIDNYTSIEFNIKGRGKVLADDTLNSVIDNIIGNAVIHGKTDKIDIQIKEQKDLCELRIADYGIGIPDKIKKKIFNEDFVYGKTGHTGLGLYIVKKAMESYGGSVYIEDNHPKGTVFVLEFRKVR
jgi:signal transduction histidine kinase/Tfp pilus assembly protein PilF